MSRLRRRSLSGVKVEVVVKLLVTEATRAGSRCCSCCLVCPPSWRGACLTWLTGHGLVVDKDSAIGGGSKIIGERHIRPIRLVRRVLQLGSFCNCSGIWQPRCRDTVRDGKCVHADEEGDDQRATRCQVVMDGDRLERSLGVGEMMRFGGHDGGCRPLDGSSSTRGGRRETKKNFVSQQHTRLELL